MRVPQGQGSHRLSLYLYRSKHRARHILPTVPIEEAANVCASEETIEIDVAEKIAAVLATLTDREREIIKLRYGLEGSEALTLEKIGERIGMTREGVRWNEARALRKLQSKLQGLHSHA